MGSREPGSETGLLKPPPPKIPRRCLTLPSSAAADALDHLQSTPMLANESTYSAASTRTRRVQYTEDGVCLGRLSNSEETGHETNMVIRYDG